VHAAKSLPPFDFNHPLHALNFANSQLDRFGFSPVDDSRGKQRQNPVDQCINRSTEVPALVELVNIIEQWVKAALQIFQKLVHRQNLALLEASLESSCHFRIQ
jgi:hypothetical protein